MFIVIHQATELWLKLMVELRAARARIVADDLQPAFKMLARVSRVQAQLIQSWDVLDPDPERLSDLPRPPRGRLPACSRTSTGCSSSFSARSARRRWPSIATRPRSRPSCSTRLAAPSLYDEAIRLLPPRLPDCPEVVQRDWTRTHRTAPSVLAAWQAICAIRRGAGISTRLAEELVDLEDWFRQWRFRHLTTVQRIISHKTGTGGTAGVPYLRRAIDAVCFPELAGAHRAVTLGAAQPHKVSTSLRMPSPMRSRPAW